MNLIKLKAKKNQLEADFERVLQESTEEAVKLLDRINAITWRIMAHEQTNKVYRGVTEYYKPRER